MNKTPLIVVFGNKHGNIINKFRSLGFDPCVDALNGHDVDWLKNNYVGPKRFYVEGVWSEEPLENPTFSISFNHDVEMNDKDWDDIWIWIGRNILMTNKLEAGRGDELMLKPEVCLIKMEVDKVVEQPKEYSFNTIPVPEEDIMVYRIGKPFVDRPYVVVIEDFTKDGHFPFFSALFVCDSWGVARSDFSFLEQAWNHLGMGGEYELEKLVRENVEACHKGKSEPRVYRKEVEEVMLIIKDKNRGIKRKNIMVGRV